MSERFEIKPSINKTGYVVIDNKKQYTFPIMSKDDCYMFCKVLNALHEENQYLQTRIQMLEGVMNTQHYYQKIADNRTDEVFQIKQTIIEAYNNERTMIGKSVLKQLMEQIQ